jgi:hypothetical protein
MPVTTRKSNATAHPGAPDLPTAPRRSSKHVAEEKEAAAQASMAHTRLALERLHAVATLEARMADEDATEQRTNAAWPGYNNS